MILLSGFDLSLENFRLGLFIISEQVTIYEFYELDNKAFGLAAIVFLRINNGN